MVRKGSAVRAVLVAAVVVFALPFVGGRAAAACGAVGTPTTTIYLPNITKTLGGPSGWVTPFIVQNVGTTNTNLEVSFFRFSDGALVTCRTVAALAPGTSFADFTNADTDLPADTQFAVVVKSFGAAAVSVVNEHQHLADPATQEALSYVGLSSGATKAYLPYVAKFVSGWLTTFVVQNLGAAFANVTITATSYDGTRNATLVRQIGPGRSAAIDPSVEPLLASGSEYAVVLSADQPIAAIANAQNDAPGVAAPMGFSYNAVAQPQVAPVYVPAVSKNADGVGRTTRLLVQNGGPADATPTLTFRTAAGVGTTVTAPAPVRAGAAWSYVPTGLADGTYALTVTGGAFAVVAASLTASTAMGVTASAGTGNRAYLPNITRTLGGPSGWTTPIVVQSTGATGATLRWYRFSDGALITRQLVTGLVNGAAVSIDPRAVPGLSDDTQYAVVADATGGPIATIVTELNFQGGDGAMGYEGFAATVSAFPVATALSVAPATASVLTGASQQLTATVKDQFDNVMAGVTLTWTVTPATLGSISASGLFTAGANAGAGTVTATVGTLTIGVPVLVTLPATQTIGGLTFVTQTTGAADIFIETTIPSGSRATIATQVTVDVAQVQIDFGRNFVQRPAIYVYTTTNDFVMGLQTIQGEPMLIATSIGQVAAGVYVFQGTQQSIGIDWQKSSSQLPLTPPRHELTHWMIQQIAGAANVPAWLNEGSARLEEFTVPGTEWMRALNKYTAVSMSTNHTLLSLADMTDQTEWNLRPNPLGTEQYYEAQQAVQLLRDDVKLSGEIQILAFMSQGQTFETAYAAVAGRTFDTFASSFNARMAAVAPPAGIVTAPDSIAGAGGGNAPTFVAYGFAPSSTIDLAIRGQSLGFINTTPTKTVNVAGVYSSYLGTDWPADTYTFTVTQGALTFTTTFAKSAFVASLSE